MIMMSTSLSSSCFNTALISAPAPRILKIFSTHGVNHSQCQNVARILTVIHYNYPPQLQFSYLSSTIKMPIGSVQANFDRLSIETIDEFQQLRRDTVEAKLYYLRDVHSPEEFDKLVDEELQRADAFAPESDISMKDVVLAIKRKISSLLNRKVS
ncbi:hypothetical protein N431DRAFT_459226 [Stipitochalara longipes BDJ]|nr:hypothetical protein N431DRAFT_459226 [Stipitochalara longipes BDJ]